MEQEQEKAVGEIKKARTKAEEQKEDAAALLMHPDTAAFVLVTFNSEGKVLQRHNASTNGLLVAEKIVNAVASAALFGEPPKET